jgi:hypothetical protein
MDVEVKKEHIQRGDVYCMECPIALALSDKPGVRGAKVMSNGNTVLKKHGEFCRMEWEDPEGVVDWIQRFDKGEDVTPKMFEGEVNVKRGEE